MHTLSVISLGDQALAIHVSAPSRITATERQKGRRDSSTVAKVAVSFCSVVKVARAGSDHDTIPTPRSE